jgi:hypothetical protein
VDQNRELRLGRVMTTCLRVQKSTGDFAFAGKTLGDKNEVRSGHGIVSSGEGRRGAARVSREP